MNVDRRCGDRDTWADVVTGLNVERELRRIFELIRRVELVPL